MKKLLALLLALAMIFALASCNLGGNPSESTPDDGTQKGTQGGEDNTPADTEIKDINAENWAKVVSEHFGLELTLPDGWSVKDVSSPNGVSNVKLYFNIGGDATYATFGEAMFAELQKDAVGNITKYMNASTVYTSFADTQTTPGIASFSANLSDSANGPSLVINYYDNRTNVEITLQRNGNWN